MARLKTFFIYAVWIVVFFIFSQVMIYVAINTTYNYKNIKTKTAFITEAELQATSINGFFKCKIFNNTNNDIENKYIKLQCYSKNDVLIGTKYIEIDKILTNEESEFEVKFNYNRVDYAVVDIIEEMPQDVTDEQKVSDQKMNAAMVISALIFLFVYA